MSSILKFILGHQRVAAIMALPVLTGGIFLASAGAVAEQPMAGSTRTFGMIAPGALGQIRYALARIGSGPFTVDDSLSRRALAGVPLASDPFAALAAKRLTANPRGTAREAALLAEAVRRNPRSRSARILSLRMMAANGDMKGAFDQLAVLNRLNAGLIESIMEAITIRIQNTRQVDEALKAISGHDELYFAFVSRMNGKRKSPEVVLRIAEGLPPHILAIPQVRNAIVRQLVESGQVTVARNIWQKGNRSGASGLVHSPDFTDTAAAPPFNWNLSVGTTGAAERRPGGGISLIYYDRTPGYLLNQLITLAPGSYRAFADFESVSGQRDNIHLRVSCEGSNAILGELPLVPTRPGVNRVSFGFLVPKTQCAGQTLAIIGAASDDRGENQLTIRRVDVQLGGVQP